MGQLCVGLGRLLDYRLSQLPGSQDAVKESLLGGAYAADEDVKDALAMGEGLMAIQFQTQAL